MAANTLPPPLLALFAPRPPLPFIPPNEKAQLPPYTGVAQFLSEFEDPKSVDYSQFSAVETRAQRKERIQKERALKHATSLAEAIEKWNPKEDSNAKSDPRKTLIIARLAYAVTDDKLKKEFEQFGPIKRVRVVQDTVTGKSRGYAFVEFEHERDLKEAYKHGEGRKIEGRRVLVDIERGRVDPAFKPRRLGGGLGSTRVPKSSKDARPADRREEPRREERRDDRRDERRDDRRDDRREERRDDRPRERPRDYDRPRDLDRPREDRPPRDLDRPREDRPRDYDRPREDYRERERDRDRDRPRDDRRDDRYRR